jgi:acyl-CoA reductase-like NAD-dependent aldehyde dehydrogenase
MTHPTKLLVQDPYDGKTISELAWSTPAETRSALEVATRTFERWRTSPSWERSELLETIARDLEASRDEYAELIRQEAGKPIAYARVEVERAIGVFSWAAGETKRFGGEALRLDTTRSGRPGIGIHQKFPRGVVLGITPFNFPLNLVAHKVAPAIAAGCPIVIKPSPYTPLSSIRLARAIEARVPGLAQVILADDTLTAELTRAPEIAQISFTGSARVGWMIRKQAPEKPTTLELGGNAWVIVLEDTPQSAFPGIAKRIAQGAYGYAGQSCISVQNAAIAADAWESLKGELAKATLAAPYGDPSRAEVISGPVIRAQAGEKIRSKLASAPPGSEIVRSQALHGESSRVIAPALVILNGPDSPRDLVQEELFGPAMTARSVSSLDEIVALVNSSRYGLQAGVYTQNLAAIERLYRDLSVGGLVINDVPTTRYDHQPYGGVKDSGQGREGVRYAMEDFCESKFLALSSRLGGA